MKKRFAILAALAGAILVTAVLGDGVEPAKPPAGPPGLVPWHEATAEEVAASPDLLAHGKALYETRCTACHGLSGKGDGHASLFLATTPRDFTRGVYKFRTTPQDGMPADLDLFRSITAGFPAYGMPSFRYLPVDDRWALVHYVKHFYPAWDRFGRPEPIDLGPEPPETPDSLERGRLLYEKTFDCAQCHGPTGRGDGPRAPELRDAWGRPVSPRNLALGPTYRKSGWHLGDTVRVVATGIPGTPMPSHLDQLADPTDLRDLWDVARYLERLSGMPDESE